MPLPECSVFSPTSPAEKGIDAVKKSGIDAKTVDLTARDFQTDPLPGSSLSWMTSALPGADRAGAGSCR